MLSLSLHVQGRRLETGVNIARALLLVSASHHCLTATSKPVRHLFRKAFLRRILPGPATLLRLHDLCLSTRRPFPLCRTLRAACHPPGRKKGRQKSLARKISHIYEAPSPCTLPSPPGRQHPSEDAAITHPVLHVCVCVQSLPLHRPRHSSHVQKRIEESSFLPHM